MNGFGNLLGYRALHKKIREVHGQKVPRNMVYAMMEFVDPSSLKERGVGSKMSSKGCFFLKGKCKLNSVTIMNVDVHMQKSCVVVMRLFFFCHTGQINVVPLAYIFGLSVRLLSSAFEQQVLAYQECYPFRF